MSWQRDVCVYVEKNLEINSHDDDDDKMMSRKANVLGLQEIYANFQR